MYFGLNTSSKSGGFQAVVVKVVSCMLVGSWCSGKLVLGVGEVVSCGWMVEELVSCGWVVFQVVSGG